MSVRYEILEKKKKEYISLMELNIELAIKLQKQKSTKFLKEKNYSYEIL